MIVAFDPDWDQLTDKQIGMIFGRDELDPNGQNRHIDGWVDKGGGFIYVAGPVNTVQLAGPREDEKRRFGPILDKLPVMPKDIRLEEVNRDTEPRLAARLQGRHARPGVPAAEGGDGRPAGEVPGRLEGVLRPDPAGSQRRPRLLQLLPGGERQVRLAGGGLLRRPERQVEELQGRGLAHAVPRPEQPGRPQHAGGLARLGRDVAAAAEERSRIWSASGRS